MTTILAEEDSVKRIGASKKSLALIDKKYKRGMPGTAPSLAAQTDAEIRQELMKESITEYSGS